MPQQKKFPRILLILSLVAVSLVLLKVLPSFKSNAESPVNYTLEDIVFDKYEVDTDVGSDEVTVYARISAPTGTEKPADVSAMLIPLTACSGEYCVHPQGQHDGSLHFTKMTDGCDGLSIVSELEGCGDYEDGIYSLTIELPQYSAKGDWLIYSLTRDLDLTASLSVGEITTSSGEKSVMFENVGIEEDMEGPEVVDFVFDSNSQDIDTTDQDVELTMYMRLKDEKAGVKEDNIIVLFSPENDPGYARRELITFEFNLMTGECDDLPGELNKGGLVGCGDVYDGIYIAEATLPKYSTGGKWDISEGTYILDTLGNKTSTFEDAYFVNLSEDYDKKAPWLKELTIAPVEFNTDEQAETVVLTLDIEDDRAGVGKIQVDLRSVISPDFGYFNDEEEFTVEDGTPVNGTFKVEITLPQGTPLGFIKVEKITIGDTLGREQRYITQRLALEFPETPLYLVNQYTSDKVTLQGGWTLQDWPYYNEEDGIVVWPDISVVFEEGTEITKKEGGEFAFHRMLAKRYDLSKDSLGTILDTVNSDNKENLKKCSEEEDCLDKDVNNESFVGTPLNIIKMGIPGLNLSFSKPVTIIIGMDPKYLGEEFIIQTFDTEREIWVNHGSCTIEMIIPESTEHGGDEYGITKPVAFPGCSFTTDHASYFSTNVLGESTSTEESTTDSTPLPGVPNTGVGGLYNYITRWIR